VLCIDGENVNRGVLPISDALTLAQKSGLDLVQISNTSQEQVPTCKILDYSKFKFEQSKKDRQVRKRQRESTSKIKELKFRPSTDEHDLSIKAKQASKFLAAGHKVKAIIVFRGREMSYVDDSRSMLREFVEMIPNAQMFSVPAVNGRQLSVLIVPKAEKKAVEVA
jgi:translation initiation factor IF-3